MPSAITPPGTAPSRATPSTFSVLMDAFLYWIANTFVPELNAICAAFNLFSTSSTSTTSMTITTGGASFTVDADKSYLPGMTVKIAATASPANWMSGVVNTYNGVNGAINVIVSATAGSGTFAAWTITLSAPVAPFATAAEVEAGTVADKMIAPDTLKAKGLLNMGLTVTAAMINALVGDGSKTDITVGSSGAAMTINAAAVSQSKLKTSTGEVSVTLTSPATENTGNVTLPGGEYGFGWQGKQTGIASFQIAFPVLTNSSYSAVLALTANGSGAQNGSASLFQRYVTSSGEVFWIFLLKDKTTGRILCTWAAPDHPCFGNGGKPTLTPHPFPDFDPAVHDLIMINPPPAQVAEIRARQDVDNDSLPDRDFLAVIMEDYDIVTDPGASWPTEEVTVGLPKGYDWSMGDSVALKKMVIPVVEYVQIKALTLK